MLYIGQTHFSDNMRKDYYGSGKAIKRALAKYGKSAFTRDILFMAFTKEDLDWAEIQIIANYGAVKSRRFYNISPGGRASLGFTNKKHTEERNRKLSDLMKQKHHSAVPVNIDGQQFNSIMQATLQTGYSAAKLRTFLKTGIHPNQQVHGGKGRTILSPTTKHWRILFPDQTEHVVFGLKPWCIENNLSVHKMMMTRKTGKTYNGFMLL